jgi:sugar-specific transcriptional regulator TrmB
VKATRPAGLRDEADVLRRLGKETGLSDEEGRLYLMLLKEGSISSAKSARAKGLIDRGMAIVSGDGKRVVPVHPRLGIANQYRTWREAMVREINDRRMRVDSLIIELIPLYEAATEKRMEQGAG